MALIVYVILPPKIPTGTVPNEPSVMRMGISQMKWDYPLPKHASRTAKASSLTLNSPGSWEEVLIHKNFFVL